MAIWTTEISELEKIYESIKGQFPALEKELGHLLKTEDENVIMLYSRRCLEVIITDLCECELKRPRKTEPLKGIIDKLNKEGKVPSHIISSMHGLNELSTYGAHPKDFDPEQVKPVLNNLATIIKWYLKYKGTETEIKTKPAEDTRQEIKSTENIIKNITISRKMLAGLLSVLIALIAAVFAVLYFSKIIGDGSQTKEVEKSIAVLPFLNDSPDQENTYFINGIMDEVLNNLQKIKDFRVLSRTSTEQYRGSSRPTIPKIAKTLDVNYIVEGSGQKYGNSYRIRVQLIEAKSDKHLWAESYEKEIKETKDIFGNQSQIAQSIAAELRATITPEEKQLIEKIPTTNLSAFDLFYQARSEHMKFWMDNTNIDGLNKAMTLYRQALLYDSTYAQAYSGLAWGYMNKNSVQTNLKTNFVDSMIIYADKAFGYNDRLDEAFYVKGQYYNITGDYDKALKGFSEAIKINPNFSWAYISRANLHYLKTHNIFSALDDNFKAIELEHGPLRVEMIKALVGAYWSMGFPENARYYLEETLKLDNDSISYLNGLANIEFLNHQNYSVSLGLSYKVLKKDPANLEALRNNLLCYVKLGKYEDAYHVAINILKIWNERGYSPQTGWEYLGYVFLETDHKKEAKYYFDKQIKLGEEVLTLDPNDSNIKIVLAEVYAILGEKGKAFELLNISKDVYENHSITESNIPSYSWLFMCKYNPVFENLCNDPIFQQYVNQLETDFNAGHEKLKAWLGEKGMLKE